jgi:hypothetical protein
MKSDIRGFSKFVKEIQVSLKSDKNNRYFKYEERTFLRYRAQFFLEWEMFKKKIVVEKIKTHILS